MMAYLDVDDDSLKVNSMEFEIIEDHHCGLQLNRSTNDQVWGKNCEYNGTVYQLLYTSEKPVTQDRSIAQYSH
jgi:hypothetical protein